MAAMYTSQDQLLSKPVASKTKTKSVLLISTAVIIVIIIITLILLFAVFDVLDSSSSHKSGMIGLWPCYGGNLQNQQTSPYPDRITINSTNIKDVTTKCVYESPGAIGVNGFPTIDDDYNAYFTDLSGFVTKIDMETCAVSWRVNVAQIMGYNQTQISVGTHQSLTLFRDKRGRRGALFGAPSRRTYPFGSWHFTYPMKAGCWAIAVDISDGSLLWKLEIAAGYNPLNWQCNVHGFFVDGDYAYGGLAQSGNHGNGSQIIGRFFKIDINTQQVVKTWYPFNRNLTIYDDHNMSYLGAGAYNFPAIIDDYVVFGTGQLYRTPYYIDECLSGNFSKVPLENSYSRNVCGDNREDDRFWRCLERDVFPDSLIILNKHTFELEAGMPLQGVDVHYSPSCWTDETSYPFCPGLGNQGPNADLSAVATFRYNNSLYVAASQKPSQLFVFEVPSGKLVISKSFGPFTDMANFNMAVDEASMIGIVLTLGANMYELNDKMRLCRAASVHAIDLKSGNTIWQMVNPYGAINESRCYNDSLFDSFIDRAMNQSCEFGEFVENGLDENVEVVIPPIFNHENKSNANDSYPLDISGRYSFMSPVTIIKDMVFIPGISGDIWVHHLLDGHFIHNFQCPAVLYEGKWNRAGFKGSVSVADSYITYYCGSYWGDVNNGNIFVSLKLV